MCYLDAGRREKWESLLFSMQVINVHVCKQNTLVLCTNFQVQKNDQYQLSVDTYCWSPAHVEESDIGQLPYLQAVVKRSTTTSSTCRNDILSRRGHGECSSHGSSWIN
jgi:hypothetical protein